MQLKIFVYKTKNGELVSENFYSDFLFIFNNIISHNFIYENDQLNLIVATEFPPKNFSYKNNEWIANQKASITEYQKLIKFFN